MTSDRGLLLLVTALAALIQTTLLNVFRLGPATPDLLLPIVVFLGLNRHHAGAAFAAFGIGYLQDSISGSTTGLNSFTNTGVFLFVYLTSRRLWVDNFRSRVVVVFVAAVIKTVGIMALLAVFESIDGLWDTAMRRVAIQATITAAIAPPMFALLSRGKRQRKSDAD